MPDESCRHCGGILIDFSQCAECKKITRLICKSCKNITTEQFHSQCILGSLKSKPVQESTIGSFLNVMA